MIALHLRVGITYKKAESLYLYGLPAFPNLNFLEWEIFQHIEKSILVYVIGQLVGVFVCFKF